MKKPIAKICPRELTTHGDIRIDNYYWLNERENPDVIAYLEQENQYQEEMMKAANMIISRTQDFAIRFAEVESRMRDTVKSIDKLKITTSESGASIITAAKNLIKAGGREDKRKKGLDDPTASMFLDSDAKWTDD